MTTILTRGATYRLCACGEKTRGSEFFQDHDFEVYHAIIRHVGGISNLRKIVENITGAPVEINRQ